MTTRQNNSNGEVFPHEQDAERAAAAVVRDDPTKRDWFGYLRSIRDWKELRRTPYGLRPLAVLIWTFFFLRLNSTVLGVALRDVIRDIDFEFVSFIRYIQFAEFAVLFLSIPLAQFADRHNRIRLVGIGVVLSGVFFGMTAAGNTPLSFGAPNFVASVMIVLATVPVYSLLADYYPPQVRGKVFALVGLASAVPSIFVPKIVGELVEASGWRPIFLATCVPLLVVGLVVLVRMREPVRGYMERKALGVSEDVAVQAEESPSFGEAWRTVFGVRTLRRLFIAGAIAAPGSATISILSTGFFFEEYGLSPGDLGNIALVQGLVTLPAFIFAGAIVDDLLKRKPSSILTFYGIVTLISTTAPLMFAAKPPLWVIIAFGALIQFITALLGPAINALYTQIVPAHVRTLGTSVSGLAAAFGPLGGLFIGLVMQANGYSGGFIFCFPFLFVSGLIFISSAPLFELDMRSAMAANLAGEEYRRAKADGAGKLLVCRGIDVGYSGVQVLFDVDFDVEAGEIIALLGTNGAGKSTLLRAIAGLTPASSGAVVYDGRDITFMPSHEIANRGIVFMPGGRGVFPALTVRENLLLGTWMIEDQNETTDRLREVFEIFPALAERAEALAGSLSGGEQQQLSLAQAFLCKPRLLMIDELSLGLSPAVVGELIEIVKRIHATGVTVIVVEQSVNVALTLAEKAIFMEKGEVKFFGRTDELLGRPDILRAVYVKGTGGGVTATMSSQRRFELEQSRPILEVSGITKRFGGITALDGVDLTLRESEVLGLIGPNGSGKTTLFDIISGYQLADDGRVVFEGVDITSMGPDARAKQGLIRRFQDARLFPALTVYETLLVSLEQQLEVKSVFGNAFGLPNARRSERRVRARADALIDLLDLSAFRDKFVKELSTGLRRVVDLACVLANNPRVLLLDEPSSGIAQSEAEGLGPLLRRVRFETGCSILIIEHDMPLISSVADELVALDRGAVVTRGLPDDVLNDERVVEAYLGGSEAAVRRSGSIR